MDLPGIGKRIERARLAAGLDRPGLAALLGVNLTTVWRWEAKDLVPDSENILKLTKLLHVSPDHLLLGTAPKKRRVGKRSAA